MRIKIITNEQNLGKCPVPRNLSIHVSCCYCCCYKLYKMVCWLLWKALLPTDSLTTGWSDENSCLLFYWKGEIDLDRLGEWHVKFSLFCII